MRIPKPFWRAALACWYLKIDKKFYRLSPDQDEAERLYHEIMANRKPAVTAADGTVAIIVGEVSRVVCPTMRARGNEAPDASVVQTLPGDIRSSRSSARP